MTAEKLRYALAKHWKPQSPEWVPEEITPHNTAQDVASYFAEIKIWEGVGIQGKPEQADVLMNKVLTNLQRFGWDGVTLEDFQHDLNQLKEELRAGLTEEEWNSYFGPSRKSHRKVG